MFNYFCQLKTIDDAIIYCKNNNNYNLLQPLQNLERKSSNLIDIYKNLYPIITKNNQLKNFFLENKNILYINQETISKLNTLIHIKNIDNIQEYVNEIINVFNKTLEIDFKNLNGSVDNLYYQILSLYRTRVSLIDYQENLSLNLKIEKEEIYTLVDNYKNQMKETKESFNNEIESNKNSLTTYNENLNKLILNQEGRIANQSTKIQSNKIEIDNISQTLENHISQEKNNISKNLENTALNIKNDIQNTKESLDKDTKELNITMDKYKKIISLSTDVDL